MPTSTALLPVISAPVSAGMLKIITQVANLRYGPGTEFPTVGKAELGDEFLVLARNPDGSWFQLDTYCWVSADLVSLTGNLRDIPVAMTSAVPPSFTLTPTAAPSATLARTSTPTQTPTQAATPVITPSPTPSPTPEASLTNWMIHEGRKVGVYEIAWDQSIGYFEPQQGKIFLSLYILAINTGDKELSFNPLDFFLVDGGVKVNGLMMFLKKEPAFTLCTVKPGGTCEGWWTTEIWDRPDVKSNLVFRWDTGSFSPRIEEPIRQ